MAVERQESAPLPRSTGLRAHTHLRSLHRHRMNDGEAKIASPSCTVDVRRNGEQQRGREWEVVVLPPRSPLAYRSNRLSAFW